METPEDVDAVMTKGFSGSGDLSLIQVSNDEIHAAESFAELLELFASEKLTVDAIK